MPVEQTDKIVTISTNGASAEIYRYGATVTSWKVSGEEKLFLSSKSHLDGSKPIRGGIPICWPIFGPPPKAEKVAADPGLEAHSKLSQHGFARNQVWKFDEVVMDREEGVSVRFTLDPTTETAKIFPHPWHLAYVVTLAKHQLSTDLHVANPSLNPLSSKAASITAAATAVGNALHAATAGGTQVPESVPDAQTKGEKGVELKFQALLHSYLRVNDSSKVKIKGLKNGLTYVDKVKGGSTETWEGGDLTITQETDRVYQDVGSENIFLEDESGKGFKVHRVALPDCVTWNPQEKTGSGMADMEPNGWDRYVCIEPGYVKEFKTLQPGEEWIGQQVITAL